MIAPHNIQLLVGYPMLAASVALALWGVRINDKHVWQRWWRAAAPRPLPEPPSRRVPFVALRNLATEYGIAFPRHGPDLNNAYEIEGALKEAAANGELTVWGRPYNGPVRDNDPLVPIPPEHFREYSFRHGCLEYDAPNDQTGTTMMALRVRGRDGLEGVTYYDLQLSGRQARAALARFAGERRA